MSAKELDVFIAGEPAGTLKQDNSGSLSFCYSRAYRGVPLSSSMPLSTQTYRDKVVNTYLWGLLPEDFAARSAIAAQTGVSPNNAFSLLSIIGLDCPGAVQFCPAGLDVTREESLIPLNEEEISRRLASSSSATPGWIADNERWSLGGQQYKFALRRQNGAWFSCGDAAATTHILKSGVRDLPSRLSTSMSACA